MQGEVVSRQRYRYKQEQHWQHRVRNEATIIDSILTDKQTEGHRSGGTYDGRREGIDVSTLAGY